jgi:putative restriction endonuclease
MGDIEFGEVDGYPEGTAFATRMELVKAGLHRRNQHGISGRAAGGCDAIVVSGGYRADEDHGDVIVYTGEGGQDGFGGRQVRDQEFTGGNAALVASHDLGLPVRVIRGSRGDPAWSPREGYRYDGLYRVDEVWRERSADGPFICRYRLVKDGATTGAVESIDAAAAAATAPAPAPGGPAPRVETVGQRLARRAEVARWAKALYDSRCQVCGARLVVAGGPYAECAHIRPLGTPHNGSDDPGNVLCLCPNDHVRLDRGAIVLSETFEVVEVASGRATPLTVGAGHVLDLESVRYQRGLWS